MQPGAPWRGRAAQRTYSPRTSLGSLARTARRLEDRAFVAAVGAYVFFGTLDCLTTASALARGARERNPVAARLYAHGGITSLYVFKLSVVALIVVGLATLPRRVAVWVATVFASVVAVTVLANTHALTTLY